MDAAPAVSLEEAPFPDLSSAELAAIVEAHQLEIDVDDVRHLRV